MGKILQGEKLRERAQKLGVNLSAGDDYAVPIYNADGLNGPADEAELQRRVMAAEAHTRGERMWRVALASAIASIVSAAAALAAVLLK